MSLTFLFWLLMILWLLAGVGWGFRTANGNYVGAGSNLLLFILLCILGFAVFGFTVTR